MVLSPFRDKSKYWRLSVLKDNEPLPTKGILFSDTAKVWSWENSWIWAGICVRPFRFKDNSAKVSRCFQSSSLMCTYFSSTVDSYTKDSYTSLGIHFSSHFFYHSTKKKVHLCDEKSVTIVSPPVHKHKKSLWRYELSLLCQGNSQLILDKTERQLSHKRLHVTSHGLTILIFILVDGNVREYYCWILSFLVQFWVNFKIILRTKADSLSFP
jgi:hypothetical protein